jgi:predicted unusual protein kinase regulating ubiquinone biosynthesis (AarF/ABC1/UbiB family)
MLLLGPRRVTAEVRRTREIVTVFGKYGFGDVVQHVQPAAHAALQRVFVGRRAQSLEPLTRARRLRLVFEELDPTFILGRQLDPSFRMIEDARPLVAELVPARLSPAALAARVTDAGRALAESLRDVPQQVSDVSKARLQVARRDFEPVAADHRGERKTRRGDCAGGLRNSRGPLVRPDFSRGGR